jgi:hypothetical protein
MKPMSASGRFCCKTPLKAQREQTRLRSMLAQVTMLPEGARAKIPRDIHEHARDVARSLVGTEAFEQSRRDRKRIEMRFAHLKRILRLGRLRLRGPRGAQVEFTLAAIAQNLRRLGQVRGRIAQVIGGGDTTADRRRCARQSWDRRIPSRRADCPAETGFSRRRCLGPGFWFPFVSQRARCKGCKPPFVDLGTAGPEERTKVHDISLSSVIGSSRTRFPVA